MSESHTFPWKQGYYKGMEGNIVFIMQVVKDKTTTFMGDIEMYGKLESGVFDGVSDKRGLMSTESKTYNLKLSFPPPADWPPCYMVLSDDGMKMTNMNGGIAEWIDEETFQKLKADTDPADNYPNTYTPNPQNPGKIIWISGGTGMGKSTTSLSLKRKHGYILYEGDAFMFGCNPYIDAAPKGGSLFGTKSLSGICPERKKACQRMMDEGYTNILSGKEADPSVWEDGYGMMCDDIIRERQKLGGDWVINQAVYTRAARNVVRRKLGASLKFVMLDMDPELQSKRLAKRITSGFGEAGALSGEVTEEALEKAKEEMKKMTGRLEDVQKDEHNTIALVISEDMSVDDVVDKILSFVG